MHICSYFHEDDHLPADVRTLLEDGLYRAFTDSEDASVGGSVAGRTDAANAPGTPAVPTALEETLMRLTRTVTFTRYTRGNPRLSERISHEAVHWASERWGELEATDPFAGEEHALDRGAEATPEGVRELAEETARHRPALAEWALRIARIDESADAPPRERLDATRRLLDLRARRALLARRWRERMERDRANHRARLLGRALGGFIRELEELVPRLAHEQTLVRDALGNEDALWDLSMHEWEELPTGGLEAATRMLEEHPEIERLAELLGRSKSVTERRTVETVEREVRLRPVGIGKTEVTGIRAGDDLTSLVASEVALLARPETADLFFTKLARRELLVLDYNRGRIVEDVRLRRVPVERDVPVQRGPAIVCVDTSGSMLGLPERVAKATVLAVARRLAADRRPVQVIAFSSQVRTFELDHEHNGLPELATFLAGSFHGGTDLRRALGVALDTLERERYEHADILVISDFRVPKIADRFLELITRQHRRGTLFHSLTVAPKPVIDPLHIFDSSWLFSTEWGKIAPESLRAIR